MIRIGALLLIALLLAPVSDLDGQTVSHLVLHPRAEDPVVAVTARFPRGSESDPAGQEGAAFLLSRVLEEEGTRLLAELSGWVEVELGPREFLVTMVAPPADWTEGWRRTEALITGGPLPADGVERVRTAHMDRLLFEEGAPGRRFDTEVAAYLLGASHPGSRPASGTRESVRGIDGAALESLRDEILDWSQAVVALVGRVDEESTQQLMQGPATTFAPPILPDPTRPSIDTTTAPGDTIPVEEPLLPPGAPRVVTTERSPPLRAPAATPDRYPWSTEGRRILDEEVTSTWILVGWPLPEGAPLVLEDFMVHLIREALNPSPPDPGIYSAQVEIRERDDTPLLVVTASVDPRHAYRWEERILQSVAGLADTPPDGAFFELARRRYRATRLLEHAAPEERARWLARTQASTGTIPRITSDVWGLTREGVADLASSRGEPRILLFGPVSVMDP
jgi:hypothetical protein